VFPLENKKVAGGKTESFLILSEKETCDLSKRWKTADKLKPSRRAIAPEIRQKMQEGFESSSYQCRMSVDHGFALVLDEVLIEP
jgi:hypothetical protein